MASFLLIGGCGNSGKNANNSNRENALIMHEKEKEGGSLETGGAYGFNSFDLEIDVDEVDSIDAEYEMNKKGLKVKYVDLLKNINLQDGKAMDEIHKLFMAIHITNKTPQQEVIDKILNWYGLETYSKFDLDVEFDDGTILKIEDIK